MKVLLTGANGFIGSHLLDRLRAAGWPVAVLLRPTGRTDLIAAHLRDVEVHYGSLTDPGCLRKAARQATHIIHTAGATKALTRTEWQRANQEIPRALIQASEGLNGQIRRLVHLSSLAAAGPGTSTHPSREDRPARPVSDYGRSKLAGEEAIRQAEKTEHVILRPPAVYGPRDTELLRLFKAVQTGWAPLFQGGRQSLSLLFVGDLVTAVLESLTHPGLAGETYHLAPPETVTARELLEAIGRVLGRGPRFLRLPHSLLWAVCAGHDAASVLTRRPRLLGRDKYRELAASGWVADGSRFRKVMPELPWTPLDKGLDQTLTWYRNQGWL